MHFIIGTAGHVDHGKTTLIRALTGIETDRLREEKERGLSIVPGFAHLVLPGINNKPSRLVGIVDVPGHERFLKNMLSGASGVDVAMLAIAADEGVMPQTTEHLRILELLQLRRGVIVLTKCDAVDDEWLVLARDDVRQKLAGSLFAEAPMVEVSAQTGAGLDELKLALARACNEIEASLRSSPASPQPFRMAIDRAFSISGFGTVVTGSAANGALSVGEAVEVWRPGDERPLSTRVRGLEVHGESASRVERGQRTAVNLAGVDLDEATRGGTLAAPGTLRAVRQIETWLNVLPDAPRPLKDKAPLRFHIGTHELEARLHLYEGNRLAAGEQGFARLRFAVPLACARGDRFVLREVGTERVTGGGVILDLEFSATRATAMQWLPGLQEAVENADDAALAEILLRRAGLLSLNEAELRLELRRSDVSSLLLTLEKRKVLWRGAPESGDEIFLHAETAKTLNEDIQNALQEFHRREPLSPVQSREALRSALSPTPPQIVFDALLIAMGRAEITVTEAAGVRLASHRVMLSEEEARLKERLQQLAFETAWQPQTINELVENAAPNAPDREAARKLCFVLIKEGKLVRVEDFALSRQRLDEGAQLLKTHIQEHGALTVGEARELLNSTRKWLVPILEYYDRSGLTRRNGDSRILR